ncbi:caspase family protein [Ensifer oleiphilus]
MAGMPRSIREFVRKLEGDDVALFFYAGHDQQVNGDNDMVPVDARWFR